MEEKRVSLDLRKDAKIALSNWFTDTIIVDRPDKRPHCLRWLHDKQRLNRHCAYRQSETHFLDQWQARDLKTELDGVIIDTSDTTKTPFASVDLPEELFLDQVRTTFVDTYTAANILSIATFGGDFL